MKASVLAYGDYTCPGDWCSYDDGGTFHKVYYVRGGDVVYHDADGEIRLIKNHLYIFPMYRKYHITHNPQDPFQVLWMHLDCYHPITFKVVDVPIAAGSIEEKILCVLSAAMEERGKLLSPLSEALLDALEDSLPESAAADERINRLLAMINQDTFISNEELAKSVSYTTSYMIRLFRRHMGITPQQYAIHLRINKAKKLLSEGKRVSETAEKLRFSDANVFSRDFSRICGYPPSEFKRQRMWGNA